MSGGDDIYSCPECQCDFDYYMDKPKKDPRFTKFRFICPDCFDKISAKRKASQFTNFGGATFDPVRDGERLGAQLCRVVYLMVDGKWRTLREIADATNDPEASVSARLRDVRKEWGESAMEARRRNGGTWEYRCLIRTTA